MNITFTGLDVRTPMMPLLRLIADYPKIELAMLYSEKRAGKEPRYPTWADIDRTVATLPEAALHVCGRAASRLAFTGYLSDLSADDRLLRDLVTSFERIQINGRPDPDYLTMVCISFELADKIITQCQTPDDPLIPLPLENHAILVDASGGRGELPDGWWRPDTDKQVGFAGGLNPENLREQLPGIMAVAKPGDWIDMESGVRTGDWFDIDKCRQVCEIVEEVAP